MIGKPTLAQENNENKVSTTPKKKITIKFGNELVNGATNSPDFSYISVKGDENFKKMMRLRGNFLPEVKKAKRDFSGAK